MEKMSLICFKEPAITMLVTSDLEDIVRGMKRERTVRIKDADGRPMVVFPGRRCNLCYAREASEEEVQAFKDMKNKQWEAVQQKMSGQGGKPGKIDPVRFTIPGRHGKS